MRLIKAAWLVWLLSALLFFSGMAGSGALIVAGATIGFALTVTGFARILFQRQ